MSEKKADLTDLVQALDRLTLAVQEKGQKEAPPVSEAGSWEKVEKVPEEDPSSSASASVDPARPALDPYRGIAYGDYDALIAQLVPCPHQLVASCKALHGGQYGKQYRAERAWEAGIWARHTLEGRVPKPRASFAIDLSPAVYVVLRAPGLESPTRVSTYSDLRKLVGRLVDSPSVVCHGFPSQAEARIYCEAAGVDYPSQHKWN